MLDGIRAHPWRVEIPPATPEGVLCRFADRIAYLSHDLIDAMRAAIVSYQDLPFRAQALLGDRHGRWVTAMVHAVVDGSTATGTVTMDPDIADAMDELRAFMFERVYLRPEASRHRSRAIRVVRDLVRHFETNQSELPEGVEDDRGRLQSAVDYVAGMTDRFALRVHAERCG